MSNVFEAVAIPRQENEPIPAGYRAVFADEILVLMREAMRGTPLDWAELVQFAKSKSATSGVAIALAYDDRVGHRSSQVCRQGSLTNSFGPETERWIPLDDDGYPKAGEAGCLASELAPKVEAECCLSALQQGLAALGLSLEQSRALVGQLVGGG